MTDRKQALTDLRDKVKVGEWPGGIGGTARRVFPYSDDLQYDYGCLAHETFNGSLDAAKALHEAVLPGWDWYIDRDAEASVYPDTNDHGPYDGIADNPARAWLLAILEALIAQENTP